MQAFVEEDRRLDAEQHRRLFHWGQLQRCSARCRPFGRKAAGSSTTRPLAATRDQALDGSRARRGRAAEHRARPGQAAWPAAEGVRRVRRRAAASAALGSGRVRRPRRASSATTGRKHAAVAGAQVSRTTPRGKVRPRPYPALRWPAERAGVRDLGCALPGAWKGRSEALRRICACRAGNQAASAAPIASSCSPKRARAGG